MNPARGRMIMRATVERPTSGTDAWGNESAPTWSVHPSNPIPCWAWVKSAREIIDGDKVATVRDFRLMMPSGTDITERDKIANISDRMGAVLFPGPIGIDTVERQPGHLELMLQSVLS